MPEEKVSLGSPQPGEREYVPPADQVPLPSEGKVYPPGSALAGKERIEIRAMTARDEDILVSRGLIKSGKVLDALLRSCVVDKNIDLDSMLAGDRNAALVAIRITGYGSKYTVEADCPVCGNRSKHSFELGALPVKRLGADPIAPGKNEFSFQLPVSNLNVIFKLPTGADERELSTILERSRKAGAQVEGMVTTQIHQQVLSIGGETDRAKLMNIVRNLPARDSRDLRRRMAEIAPGLEMKQLMKCDSCNEESEVDVPMGTEFFWPES